MTGPEQYSAYDASNPATAPEDLARIAEHRSDLRALVAGNPATPPDVLGRLGQLGDVSIDSALRRRQPGGFAAPSAAPEQPGSDGSGPSVGHDAPWAGSAAAPSGNPYAPPGAGAGQQVGAPYGQVPFEQGAPGQQVGAPYGQVPFEQGAPGQQAGTPYGQVPFSPADGQRPGAAPYGQAGPGQQGAVYGQQSPYGVPVDAGYGTSAPWTTEDPGGSGGGAVKWIIAGAVAVIAAVVVVVALVLSGGDDRAPVADPTPDGEVADPDAMEYGDDPFLDGLWDACESGDAQACDDLFMESAIDSEYETFGASCGDRFPGTGQWCVDLM